MALVCVFICVGTDLVTGTRVGIGIVMQHNRGIGICVGIGLCVGIRIGIGIGIANLSWYLS